MCEGCVSCVRDAYHVWGMRIMCEGSHAWDGDAHPCAGTSMRCEVVAEGEAVLHGATGSPPRSPLASKHDCDEAQRYCGCCKDYFAVRVWAQHAEGQKWAFSPPVHVQFTWPWWCLPHRHLKLMAQQGTPVWQCVWCGTSERIIPRSGKATHFRPSHLLTSHIPHLIPHPSHLTLTSPSHLTLAPGPHTSPSHLSPSYLTPHTSHLALTPHTARLTLTPHPHTSHLTLIGHNKKGTATWAGDTTTEPQNHKTHTWPDHVVPLPPTHPALGVQCPHAVAKCDFGLGCRCPAKPVVATTTATIEAPTIEETREGGTVAGDMADHAMGGPHEAPRVVSRRSAPHPNAQSGDDAPKRRRAWTVAEEDSFLIGVSKHGMAWQQVARDDGLHPQLKLRCLSSHTALADKYKSITMGKNEDLKERLRLACRAHATEVALTPNSDRNPNPNPHPNSDPDPDRTLDPDPPPLEEGRLHEASGSHNEEDKEREEPTNILTD